MRPLTPLLFFLCTAFAFANQGQQQPTASPQLQKTAEAVATYVRADPSGVADLFASSFLAQVPSARLEDIFKQIYVQIGSIAGVKLQTSRGSDSGVFIFASSKHFTLPVTLVINSQPDHNITGLLFGPPTAVNDSFTAVVGELRALPGQVSFLAQSLEPGVAPKSLAEWQPEQALAIGSAFKVYILGALTQQVTVGKRRWDQAVPLEAHSLPSGQLQNWPLGSPLTLDTLASLMISISDNTAADQLLRTVGRENVEAMLAPMGNGHPARNQPFLTTLEMFQLKYGAAAQRQQYLAGDAAARRVLLAKLPATAPSGLLAEATAAGTTPRDIDQLEWFASASDLCRAMAWFRVPGTSREAARGVLAINPGIPLPASKWAYVGFKGGSEPGVISLNYLLRSQAGHWYVLSAIWNDPQAPVSETRWIGLVSRAIALLP